MTELFSLISFVVVLTEEERDQMIKFSKKEYLLDQKTEASVMLGLVDIMFAYAYDVRTTEAEHSVSIYVVHGKNGYLVPNVYSSDIL